MKKQLFLLGLLGMVGFANAQEVGHDGKVGINTETPMATLEIKASSTGDKKEGLLIPRMLKENVVSMTNANRDNIEESTLLYVTDEVTEQESATFEGTGKGFYYYDRKGVVVGTAAPDARWVKVGSGAAAPTSTKEIKNIRTVENITSNEWADDDYTVVLTNGRTSAALPDPTKNKGRIIVVRNGSKYQITYTGTWTPTNNGALRLNAGNILQSDGTQWWNISSF